MPVFDGDIVDALQSQHILHLPSFFGTNKTGTTQGLGLFLTQPFSNNS